MNCSISKIYTIVHTKHPRGLSIDMFLANVGYPSSHPPSINQPK